MNPEEDVSSCSQRVKRVSKNQGKQGRSAETVGRSGRQIVIGYSALTRLASGSIGARRSVSVALSLAIALSPMAGAVPALAGSEGTSGDPEGRYLITLRNSASAQAVAAEHSRQHGAEVTLVYRHALKGYAAELPGQAVDAIRRDPRVASVEPDRTVETTAQVAPTGIQRTFATQNPALDIDGSDDLRVDADVAILDTGIDASHPDLNVASIQDCTVSSGLGLCVDGAGRDDNGHGTHVAGTVAALDNDRGVVGVAPGARLHGVKVLSAVGSGLLSWVVAGVDWVTARSGSIEVVNMSLTCRCISETLDRAISASVAQGVVYVVAAGNSDIDAREFTPANHPDVITVSALADFDGAAGGGATPTCRSDVDDTLAEFSNWGPMVEIAAPGICIRSTYLNGGYATLSGTSMASPHVAGAAAIVTSGANDPVDGSDVAAVRNHILTAGNVGWLDDSGDGLQEPLLDVGNAQVFSPNSSERTLGTSPEPSPEPGNEAPVASFVYSCSELTCSFDATESRDADGSISAYQWDLGDGTTASGSQVEKRYEASNTYEVHLTVVDDDDATSTASKEVTVTGEAGPPDEDREPISLSATGSRTAGTVTVTLHWFGTDNNGRIVVYRNGQPVATTSDSGTYGEVVQNNSGTLTYVVCEEGTDRCSNRVTLF